LAVAARWTGLEVHEVFRHSFTLALCGAALCVGAWTEKVFGSAGHAAAGALAFVFGSYQASFFPYTWGGLPSALAMWQGLAAWYCLFRLPGRGGLVASVVLLSGVTMTHHHTMVALLGGTGMVAAVGFAIWREHRAACVRVLVALVGSAVIAGIYLVPLARHAGEIGHTGTLKYYEDFAWPWEHLWGWGLPLLLTLCVGLVTLRRTECRSSRWFLLGIAIFWLSCFAVLDYVGRGVSLWMYGQRATPFTPSRFLFDVQFVAAIIAGGGLWQFWLWLRRPAFRYALVAGVACWGVWKTEPRWNVVPSDVLMNVGQWSREHLPEDALVTGLYLPEDALVTVLPDIWLTYVCRRESTSLFIPISEPASTARHRVKAVLLRAPHGLSGNQWRAHLGKPIFVVASVRDESWGSEPIFVDELLAVYDLSASEN
jgi:hypothetical protein